MRPNATDPLDILLKDPMIRLVMRSDGVRVEDMREMLVAARKRLAVQKDDIRRAA